MNRQFTEGETEIARKYLPNLLTVTDMNLRQDVSLYPSNGEKGKAE